MVDRAQKVRNGFAFRLLIVAVLVLIASRIAIHFFGPQGPADEAEIGDFADTRIDRYYVQGDQKPATGMAMPDSTPAQPVIDR